MDMLFVTYPASTGSRFDRDYYVATHLPLVEQAWGPFGLSRAEAFFPAKEDASQVAVAILSFADAAAIDTALGSDATQQILGDVIHFTDIAPILRRSEAM